MSDLLKDLYTPRVLEKIATTFSKEIKGISAEDWIRRFKRKDWNQLELKQRIRRIAEVLAEELPISFPKAVPILLRITDRIDPLFEGKEVFLTIFLGDVVELKGMDHPEEAMVATERITRLISCEFSIRPFLIRHPDLTWKQMLNWSLHENPAVRRLASEGSRPRLPWGMGVPGLKNDPGKTLPILENLKDDSDEVVRRSVANHLNDISKDHPELVLDIAERWIGFSEERDALLKHALRGLLKGGNKRALSIFGFKDRINAEVRNFRIEPKTVRIGSDLRFGFDAVSKEKIPRLFRIEYKIEYAKVSGKTSIKVFQIDERTFLPGESVRYDKKQSFKQMTTRVHVPGKHRIEVHINGNPKAAIEFRVVE
ncbi:DNA alkylation repair protein [Leptospira gomenensis]|uniref:DNA alkylation repair protein n=1 Tax=Leptospira gomenensis TaxID=2484974 RepID=A0A5F1YNH1_9LEPT|nr:DNA alkylation repair protein [Leptospira gomenensis]TGK32741.1 DNA alkylation repair protein [Leptospira gomenensis]TGK36888.1 DNA alkylation repair protein [Leptospira gomenensis]TGK44360.1 DNA alkylation repair protein [Leptospira gomenensis]TGK58853.1 DNA alkylation repair protein [Leptospira gomenensis]